MPDPAVQAAGIQFGGTLLSGLFGGSSARKSRAFTREMMQNKIQWATDDLRKAGLNPIMAAGMNPAIGGSAQASMSDPQLGMVATQAKLADQQSQLIAAQANSAKLQSQIDRRVHDKIVNEEDEDALNALVRHKTGQSTIVKGAEDVGNKLPEWLGINPDYHEAVKKGAITFAGLAAILKFAPSPAKLGKPAYDALSKLAKSPQAKQLLRRYKLYFDARKRKANIRVRMKQRNTYRRKNR